jgi:hypothetical protein
MTASRDTSRGSLRSTTYVEETIGSPAAVANVMIVPLRKRIKVVRGGPPEAPV